MTTEAQSTSVLTHVTVEAPLERAFRVFVEQFDKIKPREHNLLAVDVAETVLEPRAGGRIYDRGVDGSECRWATVIAYDPPHRFAFSWNITTEWKLETDPEKTSEVEITFTEDGPDRTRVALEHRHIERHGDGWEGMSSALGSGWPTGLERFAGYLSGSGPGTAA